MRSSKRFGARAISSSPSAATIQKNSLKCSAERKPNTGIGWRDCRFVVSQRPPDADKLHAADLQAIPRSDLHLPRSGLSQSPLVLQKATKITKAWRSRPTLRIRRIAILQN